MIRGYGVLTQTLLGTLFTWGLTAAGAALVFLFNSKQDRVLDGSLGFASGVMIAATFWSLLDPAIEIAKTHVSSPFTLVPVIVGFFLGSLFVYSVDQFFPHTTPESFVSPSDSPNVLLNNHVIVEKPSSIRLRKPQQTKHLVPNNTEKDLDNSSVRWRRIMLLIVAITVHNIPEGLAVGVGFGAINKTESSTFENARNLAVGIGIQNFPEGLAVSLPLRGAGLPPWKCFWYGQLSGAVEPIAGLLGALAIAFAEPLLPYALAFAAGAMFFVVLDDIVPEAQCRGNGKLSSWASVAGFLLMMTLDVGLGS